MDLVKRATIAAKAYMKTGSASRMSQFFVELQDLANEQTAELTKEAASLEKRIKSATQHKTEFCLNLDKDKLKDIDVREEYVVDYFQNLVNFDSRAIGSKKKSTKSLKKDLKIAKEQIVKIEDAVNFLSNIEAPAADDLDMDDASEVIIGKPSTK